LLQNINPFGHIIMTDNIKSTVKLLNTILINLSTLTQFVNPCRNQVFMVTKSAGISYMMSD